MRVEETDGGPWRLSVRIPPWAGRTERYPVEERDWRPGDEVRLDLPMEPRWIRPDPRIDAVRGCVAVGRGPLVYCAESLGDDPPLSGLHVDTSAPPEERIDSDGVGGTSGSEEFGNLATLYAFVDTDGAIQGLDVLRICEPGMHETGLRVQDHDFTALLSSGGFAARCLTVPPPICERCRSCSEARTCAGGYLPHRYSRHNGFDNPSVWCADILRLFAHIRNRFAVSAQETDARRRALPTLGSP